MIKNLVFSGGGFKAWAYIGSLRVLEEHPNFLDIEQVVGVSAGGVFGLFYVLGIKWDFLLDFFMNLNFKELFDIDIDNIIIQQSILAGIKFTELIKEIMSYRIDPGVTFMELYRHSKIKFTTSALNITDSKLEYFNYELTPNVKVIDAVRASCSLPVVLPPYFINGKYYYDGGICNNCPIDTVDENNSIAFDVAFYAESNQSPVKLIDLLNSLVTISNRNSKQSMFTENIYTILDTSFSNESVNLNQSRDDIFNIYMNGYINSKNIFFKNHIALPAP
jgi:NTE family protein